MIKCSDKNQQKKRKVKSVAVKAELYPVIYVPLVLVGEVIMSIPCVCLFVCPSTSGQLNCLTYNLELLGISMRCHLVDWLEKEELGS